MNSHVFEKPCHRLISSGFLNYRFAMRGYSVYKGIVKGVVMSEDGELLKYRRERKTLVAGKHDVQTTNSPTTPLLLASMSRCGLY